MTSGVSSITDLLEAVKIESTAELILIDLKLREVARELFSQSEVWQEDIALETVADQATYTLTPTAGAKVHRIDQVKYDDSSTPLDEETYRLNLETRSLVFEDNYIPSASGNDFTATVVLIPYWKPDAVDLPTALLERYADGLVAGALCKLPRRLLFDPERLPEWKAKFAEAKGTAVMDRERKGTQRPMSWEA